MATSAAEVTSTRDSWGCSAPKPTATSAAEAVIPQFFRTDFRGGSDEHT
jgi:hypothetical protein